MRVTVEKITDVGLMREACEFTMKNEKKSNMSLEKIYENRHSPLRTQLFIVRMYDIPYEVAVHFRTHDTNGQLHFVGSGRKDRDTGNRNGLTDHMMILNSQHLMHMANDRLCYKAMKNTLDMMGMITREIFDVDPDLYYHLVPKCVYLQRCPEGKDTCGFFKGVTSND